MASRRETEFELRSSWAREVLLDESLQEEMQQTVLAYQKERGSSTRALAMAMGVPPRRLRAFLQDGVLTEADWKPVASWCADKHTPRVSPDRVAVRVLVRRAPRRLIPRLVGSLMVAIPIVFWLAGTDFPPDAFDSK